MEFQCLSSILLALNVYLYNYLRCFSEGNLFKLFFYIKSKSVFMTCGGVNSYLFTDIIPYGSSSWDTSS